MKTNKKLFAWIIFAIVISTIFLWREIKNYKSITTSAVTEPPISDKTTNIPISSEDQILGNPGAPLTIVEYADLNNSESKSLHLTLEHFVNSHPESVRLIFKHAPEPHFIFADATLAHQAAYCAGKLNKLWSFTDALINKKYNLRESGLKNAATDAGITNIESWWNCTNSDSAKNTVALNLSEAMQLNLGNPPLIFFNNRKFNAQKEIDLPELLSTLITP